MKLTSLCVAPNSSSNKLHLSSATRNRSLTWKQKSLRLCTHLPLKVRPPRRHWCDATSPPLLDVNVKEASSSTALHFQFEKKLPPNKLHDPTLNNESIYSLWYISEHWRRLILSTTQNSASLRKTCLWEFAELLRPREHTGRPPNATARVQTGSDCGWRYLFIQGFVVFKQWF